MGHPKPAFFFLLVVATYITSCYGQQGCYNVYMARPYPFDSALVEHRPTETCHECCNYCNNNSNCESFYHENTTCLLYNHTHFRDIFYPGSCAGMKIHDPSSTLPTTINTNGTTVTTTRATTFNPNCGPEEFKLIPHPENCNQYFACAAGDIDLLTCTGSQQFDCFGLNCRDPPVNCSSNGACSSNDIRLRTTGGGIYDVLMKGLSWLRDSF